MDFLCIFTRILDIIYLSIFKYYLENTFKDESDFLFYLFWVLRRFQHCTGHITTGS